MELLKIDHTAKRDFQQNLLINNFIAICFHELIKIAI